MMIESEVRPRAGDEATDVAALAPLAWTLVSDPTPPQMKEKVIFRKRTKREI